MNKTLWLMCGAPGSGKTWFAKNKLMKGHGWDYISRDEIRFSLVKEDEDYFSHESEVFYEFVDQIVESLKDGNTDVIADATHLNWSSRKKLLKAIERYMRLSDINIIPVVVYSKYDTMVARNQLRGGRACVPDEVISKMISSMSDPQSDPFNYTAIMRVSNT